MVCNYAGLGGRSLRAKHYVERRSVANARQLRQVRKKGQRPTLGQGIGTDQKQDRL